MDKQVLIDAVREHARENYSTGKGWDEIEECYDDGDILRIVGKCRTESGAVRAMAKIVRLRHSVAEDIRAASGDTIDCHAPLKARESGTTDFTKVIEIEVIKGSFPVSRWLTPGEREEIGAAAQSLPEGKYDVCFYYTEDREDRGYTVFRHGLLDLDCVCSRGGSAAFCDCRE